MATSVATAQLAPQFVLRTPVPLSGLVFTTSGTALDIDGDGDQDLLLVSGLPQTLQLWRNDGDGRFTDLTATNLPTNVQSFYRLLAFDCDGDGDRDVFVGGYNGGVSTLLRNGGNGSFTGAPMSAGFPAELAAADLDGDGDLDLAITETGFSSPQQRLWRNNGTGSFAPAGTLGSAVQGSTIHPFDYDGDGDVDLLCGKNPIRLWRNDGGFVFTDIGATAIVQPTGNVLGVHAAGDLDGDGDVDLIVSRNGSNDVVMLQQGGVFAVGGSLPHSLSPWLRLDDVDRDGDLDVVHGHTMRLSLNDGSGAFTDGAARMPAIVLSWPAVGDLDGDGDTDWLGAASTASVGVMTNRAVDLAAPSPRLGQPWNVVVASEPGYATAVHPCLLAIGFVRQARPVAIAGVGDLWLDLGAAVLFASSVAPAAGQTTFPLQIPADPQLVGLVLHLQGLVSPVPAAPRFTAAIRAVIG